MLTRLLLFSFLISTQSFSCEIELYTNILKIKKTLDASIFKKENCQSKNKQSIIKLLSDMRGTLRSSSLENLIHSELNIKVKVLNKKNKISSVKDIIAKSILNSEISISSINAIADVNSLNIDDISSLKIKCSNCDYPGMKSIKLEYDGKSIWFNTNLLKRTASYIFNDSTTEIGQTLTKRQLTKTQSHLKSTQGLFTNYKNLKFYKTNKRIKKGHILKRNDLIPLRLVRAGQSVRVKFNSDSIRLNSSALAKQSGYIGERVELINKKSNKKLYGTITDFNEVSIKL